MKVIQDSTLSEDKKKDARDAFAKINEKVVAYQESIIAKYPNTLTAVLFKASTPVTIPPAMSTVRIEYEQDGVSVL